MQGKATAEWEFLSNLVNADKFFNTKSKSEEESSQKAANDKKKEEPKKKWVCGKIGRNCK